MLISLGFLFLKEDKAVSTDPAVEAVMGLSLRMLYLKGWDKFKDEDFRA